MFLKNLSPINSSIAIHLVIGIFFAAILFQKATLKDAYQIPIYENPAQDQMLSEIKDKPSIVLKSINQPTTKGNSSKQVFGLNRNSILDEDNSSSISVKQGNTIAKEVDDIKLEKDDPDALPTPTEEYLVSKMPSVAYEVRPEYPAKARELNLTGVVSMSILIDDKGLVRQIQFISGEEIFKDVALNAMAKFKFNPAQVDGKPVAVRIRYTIRFNLDY